MNGPGRGDPSSAIGGAGPLLAAVALFSAVFNLLMLVGPLFMLQVYDRVLASRSEATLVALSGIVAFLFLAMALLDAIRSQVMHRIAAQYHVRLAPQVFLAALRRAAVAPDDPSAIQATRDLDVVRAFIASPVAIAAFDIPFLPVFLCGLFLFHPMIGWMAVGGGACLLSVLALNQWLTRRGVLAAQASAVGAEALAGQLRAEAGVVQALGMRGPGLARWSAARIVATADGLAAQDARSAFGAATRTLRLFVQSALLALGAWLVLRDELSPGAMVAASILLGRALAPVEQAVSGWPAVHRAREARRRLAALSASAPAPALRSVLAAPKAHLCVSRLSVVPPGATHASLRNLSFTLEPGQALGVIGPSGSGKSTLAMALTSVWRPASGTVRLDGATPDLYDADRFGRSIGYLPQRVSLFDGTIADNIARLDPAPDAAMVIAAARQAGVHELVLALPDGYDTAVSRIGGRLSGGQIQRIGLARALFGEPALLILDEPNASLDNEGSAALNQAVRAAKAAGRGVLIMAHRPAAIQECDRLLVLERGQCKALGPRDAVLREVVRNAGSLLGPAVLGGVA